MDTKTFKQEINAWYNPQQPITYIRKTTSILDEVKNSDEPVIYLPDPSTVIEYRIWFRVKKDVRMHSTRVKVPSYTGILPIVEGLRNELEERAHTLDTILVIEEVLD